MQGVLVVSYMKCGHHHRLRLVEFQYHVGLYLHEQNHHVRQFHPCHQQQGQLYLQRQASF